MRKRFSGRTKLLTALALVFAVGLGSLWFIQNRDGYGKGLGCGSKQPGTIIFYYREGTSDDRLNDIIKSVHGSVTYNYSSLHGFAIDVPKGSEDMAIASLKKNSEVGTVSQSRILCTQGTAQ
jgi:hypothetical protein